METTTVEKERRFYPVYEKDGHRFIVVNKGFFAGNREDAMLVKWGSMLVECIMLGMKATEEILETVEGGHLPHVNGKLSGMDVAILSGPMFDAMLKQSAQTEKGK